MLDQVSLLLAEDEPLIQLTLQQALEEGGFAVAVTSTGEGALAAIEERGTELAGLVTDIRLGNGPDGWALAHRARELNPQICVIYMTGDSAAEWAANGVPNSVLLQKPFVEAQLLTAISALLNEASGNTQFSEGG